MAFALRADEQVRVGPTLFNAVAPDDGKTTVLDRLRDREAGSFRKGQTSA